MHVIQARNVNDAYRQGMQLLVSQGIREGSRAGEVLACPSPVTTVYSRPQERVLFDSRRDANPFFHLMEAVWMLAGRRDANFLDRYVRDFSSRFGESNKEAHGAYGHRWRRHFPHGALADPGHPAPAPMDQLYEAGRMLLEDPGSRRVVIAMWDPTVDLGAVKADIPCNDLIMLRGRQNHIDHVWELDVTVCCRSNDAVWGAYGANAVHMSIMAEVVAGLAGMRLGRYYQVSNNFHVYLGVLNKVWPSSPGELDFYLSGYASPQQIVQREVYSQRMDDRREAHNYASKLLVECEEVCSQLDAGKMDLGGRSPWITNTVAPMHVAHRLWAKGERDQALATIHKVHSADWRMAGAAWMMRRQKSAGVAEVRSA